MMKARSELWFVTALWALSACSAPTIDSVRDAGDDGLADGPATRDVVPPPPMPRDSLAIPRLRRLTRDEVGATLRDLLAEPEALARDLPGDPIGTYFDNLTESQFFQTLHARAMIEVAQNAIARAWSRRATPAGPLGLRITNLETFGAEMVPLVTPDSGPDLAIEAGDSAVVRLRANVRPANGRPGAFEFRVVRQGLVVGRSIVRLDHPGMHPLEIEVLAERSAGRQDAVTLYASPLTGGRAELQVHDLRVEGPVIRDDQRIGACDVTARGEETCAQEELGAFAERAWRRRTTESERSRLLGLYRARRREGDTYADALQLALAAILASPQFLFLIEAPPGAAPGSRGALDAWGRASRLSYFLWGSMPDPALRAAAASGRLLDRDELIAQTQRMIDDPRFASFARRFGGGWLGFGGVFSRRFSDAEALPALAFQEALANFTDAVRNNLRVSDFFVSADTWVNDQLREFYGLPQATAGGWRRLPLHNGQRRGFLTQAAFLLTFERSTVRGLAVLSRFLCERPPPPPSNSFVSTFAASTVNLPVRLRLLAHSQSPNCAGCHGVIDPMGFAFGHFDTYARWRDTEAGAPVDTSGRVSGFGSFQNLPEFIELLRNDRRVTPCAANNLVVFATGRSDAEDEGLARAAAAHLPWRDLINATVTSDVFLSYEVSL